MGVGFAHYSQAPTTEADEPPTPQTLSVKKGRKEYPAFDVEAFNKFAEITGHPMEVDTDEFGYDSNSEEEFGDVTLGELREWDPSPASPRKANCT